MEKSLILASVLISSIVLAGCNQTDESTSQNTSETEAASTTNETQTQGARPQMDGINPEDRPARPEMDLKAAAETLGVTVEELQAAIGAPEEEQGPSAGAGNLEEAAEILGVTAEELREALGLPEMGEGGTRGSARPPMDNN